MTEALALALAYLLGSVPSGYLAGRLRGVDIRTVGSRNVGASNVFRSLGRSIGVAVMVADIAKGVAAVLVAKALVDDPWPVLAAGAAVAGHVWPVWLRFRGGKGVATGGGVVIALVPLAAAVLFPVWIIAIALTRYISVGSITCAVIFTPLAWAFDASWPTLVFGGAASTAVLWKHRGNVSRLLAGTELRVELRGTRRA